MKSKLLGESQVNELLAVKSIEEVTELLEETSYKDELVELSIKYSGVELVNRAVELNFNRAIKKLSSFLPSNRATFDLVLEEWTIQNLKAITASKATGMPLSETALVKVNEEQNTLFSIANDPTVDLKKLIRKLSFMGLGFSQVFKKIDREYNDGEISDFRLMFKELDDYYYAKLAVAAEKESEPAVKALLLAKVSFINTMSVARLKLAGVSDKEINNNVIKGFTRLKWQAARLIDKKSNVEEVVEEIVKTHKLASEIVEEFKATHSLVKLEVELQRNLVSRALRTSKVSVLSFAVILAFIYLKQEEISFIKAIAYSTQAGIREEIKNLVFAVK